MAAMLEEQNKKTICIKIKLFSQWKGIVLFFSSSMATANTLYTSIQEIGEQVEHGPEKSQFWLQ